MTAYHRLSAALRHWFFAGLAILVPIILTTKALHWLFAFLDGLAQPLANALFGRPIAGLGFILTIATVLVTGLLFSLGPLKRLLAGTEELLDFVPLVGAVYGTTKKVLSGFGPQSEAGFKRFVLARLPGRTTPGFLTGTFTLKRADGTVQVLCTVYVPTNHLYVGDVVVLPASDVLETDLSLEDGIGLIVSGGASVPAVVLERRGETPS
jgi:uncharacterized membrane protein